MTTIPDDMVERVGRALAAAADDEFEPNRDFWGRYSRAAIESIQPYILPYILGADGPFVRDSDHCAAILAAEKRGEERERGRTDKALREYRARLNDIPLGHENAQRGASTYNWKVTVYEEIAAAIRKGSD